MLPLLLAAVTSVPFVPPPEARVALTFPGGPQITVVSSPNTDGYSWTHAGTVWSPDRRAAAVLFCWEALRFTGCEVKLAQPGRPVLALPNSFVRTLVWTPDSQYLLGGGYNTLRLWNRAGQGRAVQATSASRHGDPPLVLTLVPGGVCARSRAGSRRFTLPGLRAVTGSCPSP